ncbi:ABC transporter permease [Parabacteroides acidifaciens]|uniref:ABC transporter permease n=1 Tax=Parabacteroides acidifaciens TaxID=2290935 RepID=A0A3D8HI35_9BACT|nr:ABC transporter permease [Parabacteroides acidifaciens]MBC8600637.1 ABC transporter permease [Parabacteroides acidifaciens]RDU50639.1 ABC transporter permease [Parabacteroides acidifaciens]
MLKIYLKQAWNLIRQERLFSLIYVVGTGLSVSMVMVLSIVFYMRVANIYPETNRDRILVAKSGTFNSEGGGQSSSSLSEGMIDACFGSLKGVEAIALMAREDDEFLVQPEGDPVQLPVTVKFVNTDFWRVFPFRFLEGKAFTEADQQSAIRTAVIARSLAHRLFGDEEATGKYISVNFRQYRVCGIVQDASLVTEKTYAQIWFPYTVADDYKPNDSWNNTGVLGKFNAYILASRDTNLKALKQEAEERVERYGKSLKGGTFTALGQPDYYWQSTFRYWSNSAPDFGSLLLQYGLIVLILLLVPSVSLSGMTDSRMERRLAEMGVRRAFGAPTGTLMGQIISENFLFTFLGGLFGLLFSYLLIYLSRDWILQLDATFVDVLPEGADVVFTPGMLMNFQVFGIALFVCFVLNLLSALIPAWRASHRQIIYSLNAK